MPPEKRNDEQHWAKPVSELHVSHDLPPEAVNLNVEGRRVAGVAGGFGQMWQKTYRVLLPEDAASPEHVIAAWKSHFPDFWPKQARFFAPMAEISPGDVALLNMEIGGGVKMSTGVLVLYADDRSFSFLAPEGAMFSGMLTFSAMSEGDATVAQAQALIRAQDPLYEMGMKVGIAHRQEDRHWKHTLEALARHFGVETETQMERVLIDKRRQWRYFGNIRRSAALRSALYSVTHPFGRTRKTEV